MLRQVTVILVLCAVSAVRCQFDVPEAIVEVFKPKGLKISIPDVEGIKLFAVHASFNQDLGVREPGQINRDILRVKDGRWTFYDPQAKLKVGDVINYWLYVDYFNGVNKLGYESDEKSFQVQALISLTGNDKDQPGNQGNHGNSGNHGNGNGNKNKHTTQAPHHGPVAPAECTLSRTVVNGGATACQGALIFEDNFQTFDAGKWKKDVFIPGSPDYEFVVYINFPQNVDVRNNNLNLKPTLSVDKFGENYINNQINLGRNCTGIPGTNECDRKAESFQILPPVISGRVKTKDLFSFRYGKVEIRAKLPKGKWIYPQLFLEPKDNAYGLDYDSGQIRIAYSAGNAYLGNELQGGVILGTSTEARNFGIKAFNTNQGLWSDEYHTYTLHWTPEEIVAGVDGNNYSHNLTPIHGYAPEAGNLKTSAGQRWAEGDPNAPFDKEMYLVLGVGVGGHNFPNNVDAKPYKNKDPKNMLTFWNAKDSWYNTWSDASIMRVDYVKVWAL